MGTFDFAMQMEQDGAQFYQKQAEHNKNNALCKVFEMLAAAETKHAELMQKRAEIIAFEHLDESLPKEARSLFAGLKDYKSELYEKPPQLEIYRLALEMEQKSIDLYKKMLTEVAKDQNKALLRFLIKEEQMHYDIFDELVLLLNRPVEWVEAAEFGEREEY